MSSPCSAIPIPWHMIRLYWPAPRGHVAYLVHGEVTFDLTRAYGHDSVLIQNTDVLSRVYDRYILNFLRSSKQSRPWVLNWKHGTVLFVPVHHIRHVTGKMTSRAHAGRRYPTDKIFYKHRVTFEFQSQQYIFHINFEHFTNSLCDLRIPKSAIPLSH